MAPSDSEDAQTESQPANHSGLILVGLLSVSVTFLINDLLGLINGGGLISILSALKAVHNRNPIIDVDGRGLLTLFTIGLCAPVLGISNHRGVDLEHKPNMLLAAFTIMWGAFLLDGVCADAIIADFFQTQGYTRCAARDHSEGRGKGQVWFHDFVRDITDCPTVLTGSS